MRRNILIVIAARGGSKGVKDKNIRKLAGKPLIAYTVEQAISWGKADRIVCSTDSETIAKQAMRHGADVFFLRPRHLSGDSSPKLDTIKHALIMSERQYNKTFDIIVDLDVTSIMRTSQDLDNCLRIFQKRRLKTLFSVTKSRKNPYFNIVELRKDKTACICKTAEKMLFSRQLAPITYDMNASILFCSRDYLLSGNGLMSVSDNSGVYVMDEISAVDIDTELDFKFVEFLIKKGVLTNGI